MLNSVECNRSWLLGTSRQKRVVFEGSKLDSDQKQNVVQLIQISLQFLVHISFYLLQYIDFVVIFKGCITKHCHSSLNALHLLLLRTHAYKLVKYCLLAALKKRSFYKIHHTIMATNFLLPDNPFYKDFILQAVSLIKVSRDSISKCLITVKHVII